MISLQLKAEFEKKHYPPFVVKICSSSKYVINAGYFFRGSLRGMKVGIYVGSIPPPVFINNLVNGLADEGYNVFIYGKPVKGDYQFLNPSILQRKFPITKFGVILYSIYILVRLIFDQPHFNLNIVKIVRQNSKNWSQFLQRLCRVMPPFIDKLDIFHIQWAKTLVYYPEFIEKLNCPVLLSLRGAHINYSPLGDQQLAMGYMKYFPMVAGFHAVSAAIAKESEKYAADPNKINVIRPAVNSDLINIIPSKKMNNSEKLFKIISVGRCHWKKGYTFALDAMAILKKEKMLYHYTIIASGDDYEHINYQIQDLGLNGFVSFINGLSHSNLIERVSESDIFILPSLEEGISNAVLEAMALGVPVISTDCGGMTEIINNGENGFIVPVRESKIMAEKIIEYFGMNREKKIKIIKNARQTINNNLLEKQITMMKQFYINNSPYNR